MVHERLHLRKTLRNMEASQQLCPAKEFAGLWRMFLKEVGLRPDLEALKIETAPREWGREFQMVCPEKG